MYDFSCVDAHMHPFISNDNNIARYASPASPEELVALLKDAGITLCCGSVIHKGWVANMDTIRKCHEDCFKFQAMFPDFFIPGVLIHAAFPEESCREIEKYHRTGDLRWVGEIVPYTTGTSSYSIPELDPVYDYISSLGLPINIHPTGEADIAAIARKFPKLNIVMAHPGERESFQTKLDLMKELPNLHLDICGTGLFRWGMLKHGVNEVGADRFLFGSDFPVCNAWMNRQAVLSERLTQADEELIFSGNFRRLTGL